MLVSKESAVVDTRMGRRTSCVTEWASSRRGIVAGAARRVAAATFAVGQAWRRQNADAETTVVGVAFAAGQASW